LHAVYVSLQAVLMIALMAGAHRFSTELDAAAMGRDWVMRLPYHSNVWTTAVLVGLPGLAYPMVLAFAYWLYGRSKTRLPAR
jgi:hypothetical protein